MAKTKQRFEETVKNLIKNKIPTITKADPIVKTSKKKESFVSFHSAIKKILDKKYAYRPNIATTRVRQIKDGLKYEWKFKNYSLKINLYANSIALFINTPNKQFIEYFKTNSHNAIFKYPTDKQFALVYDKYDNAYVNINIELSNKILYLSRANYEYIPLSRDLVEYLENIITTFEELDSQIELYKHANKVAKSTVKKITKNLKTKKENPITYESAIKKEWKALTHEQWVEKSEAARLKLIAAISKDRQETISKDFNTVKAMLSEIDVNDKTKFLGVDLKILPNAKLEETLRYAKEMVELLKQKQELEKKILIEDIANQQKIILDLLKGVS